MLSIRTNLSSLIAQNSMRTSTNKLNQAIERMTTGSKINHAKDNAANYSISTNMQTRMGALRVAEDNALQGLEMMSSTSENLSLIEEKLVRMRALAVQAQSGTYGTKSLSALSAEAGSLLNEINRINESATYNGIKLFSTGKDNSVTNAGKELKLNEQGFLQDVVKVDTTGMTALGSMADDATLAVGEYTISTPNELVQLQEMCNAGLVESGSTFVLEADIDLASWCQSNLDANGEGGWTPIKNFAGTFNGNGYSILNLYINRPNTDFQGLFSNGTGTWGTTTIKNLNLKNTEIIGRNNVGGVIGGGANITNCSVINSKIKGNNFVGGLLGGKTHQSYGWLYFEGDVVGNSSVGGCAGQVYYASISNSFSKGTISGVTSVGGVTGWGETIKKSKSIAIVFGTSNVGGITGFSHSPVEESYFDGTVLGETGVGGIAGYADRYSGYFKNCIIEGKVQGSTNVGALLGLKQESYQHKLENSYYYSKFAGQNLVGAGDSLIIDITDITIPCDYTFQIGTTGDDATSSVAYTTYIDFTPLKELLTNGVDSTQCLAKIDELVEIVSLKQAELGTMENRLMSVLDEISTQYENLVSSHSTIKDADMAKVSSQYIQQQILQDASATLLASTQNIQYQNVMGLLQSLQR